MRIFAQVTGRTISQGNTKSLVASTLWILCNPACPTENIFSQTAEGLSWYVGGFCSWLRKTREGLGKFGELSLPYFCVIVPYIPSASALPSTLSPSTNKLSFLHKSKKKKKGGRKIWPSSQNCWSHGKVGDSQGKASRGAIRSRTLYHRSGIDKIPCGIKTRTKHWGAEQKYPSAWGRGSKIAASTAFLGVSNKSTRVYLLISSLSGQKILWNFILAIGFYRVVQKLIKRILSCPGF